MPLAMIGEGEPVVIKRIKGNDKTRLFIEKLGFVTGSEVTVIAKRGNDLIVKVKDSRIAVGRDIAMKIFV